MEKEKIIIFGTGDIAQIANYYFETDSNYEVVAFTVDKAYCNKDTFEHKPLIAFEDIETLYSPNNYKLFIALSYTQMNKLRETKYQEAKLKGYQLVSYISSRCTYLSQFKTGDNCFIFEDNTIQPYVIIKDNVTLWSGNHIGHHSVIESHNFVSSHVVISGHCHIQSNCFIGVNATIAHKVKIASQTLIGAGSIISKDTEELSVYVPAKSIKLNKSSNQFTL